MTILWCHIKRIQMIMKRDHYINKSKSLEHVLTDNCNWMKWSYQFCIIFTYSHIFLHCYFTLWLYLIYNFSSFLFKFLQDGKFIFEHMVRVNVLLSYYLKNVNKLLLLYLIIAILSKFYHFMFELNMNVFMKIHSSIMPLSLIF